MSRYLTLADELLKAVEEYKELKQLESFLVRVRNGRATDKEIVDFVKEKATTLNKRVFSIGDYLLKLIRILEKEINFELYKVCDLQAVLRAHRGEPLSKEEISRLILKGLLDKNLKLTRQAKIAIAHILFFGMEEPILREDCTGKETTPNYSEENNCLELFKAESNP
jgi:hypothetical protein